ncbi:anti-sigma factor [Catellatospora sp. KI3]|uniref:anti-sigma factor n=1 Tax=Catellatospora sp. KI3 TaxID=3041620 RepID=UPI002482A2CC|nr:anti-sigma factor [Catellatospora sp. KI3]MDI1463444.1 anti-sigma factor [Catellatospora sp. KI3]
MRHLDRDQLVLLAFDDLSEEPDLVEHLAACGACRQEVIELQRLSGVVAETRHLRELPAPPPAVWAAIAAQTGVESGPTAPPDRGPSSPGSAPAAGGRARPPAGRPPKAAGTSRPPTSRRWARLAVSTALVLAALAAGVTSGVWWARPQPSPRPLVVAAAQLTAYGDTPASALGRAEVVDGHRLHLHVDGLPPVDGYYEVWLIDPDSMRMFSVGTLGGGSDGEFSLPANADLGTYRLVDVSAEHFDNNTAHSGDSLLRGLLG